MVDLGVDNRLRCMRWMVFELGGGGSSILVCEMVGGMVSRDARSDEILVGEFVGNFARALIDWRADFGFVVLSDLTRELKERVDQIVMIFQGPLHHDALEKTHCLGSTSEASHLARNPRPNKSQAVNAP